MSKFSIITNTIPPNCCALCMTGAKDGLVDTTLFFEFHGALYFCIPCLTEMYKLVPTKETDTLRELVVAKAQLEAVKKNYTTLREGLYDLVRSFPNNS